MQEFPILINITVALVVAFVGGILARYLKVSTLVGYLVAGIIISPFTPGFVGDIHTIRELADLGVIFLLFGVGLHFSLRDLWAVRMIAIPGAVLQMALSTIFGVLLARLWGWPLATGVVLGLAISIASTVVLLRNLMDQGLLNTSRGQLAVGWSVLEDLATVLILVLLPALSTSSSEPLWQTAGLALLKAGGFAVLMLVAGIRIIPWFLTHIAQLRSRELFIVAVMVITLGIAMGAASLFGVSLALGAFLAGLVVNTSALSHQVEAEVLPFRETFALLFFVSVGMLVNPALLLTHAGEILSLTALIILGKGLLAFLLVLLFARSLRMALTLAVGIAQIGEFSFLLGQTGASLKLLTQEQYTFLLTGALISIILNPFLFQILPWVEARLQMVGAFRSLSDRQKSVQEPIVESLREHVVIIGCGRVGRYLLNVLSQLEIPFLVVELDVRRVTELERQGIRVLYGDAADSDILSYAHLEQARAVVATVPDEAGTASVVAKVRAIAPQLPLVVRAATQGSMRRLLELGVREIIYPELEGGLQIMEQTLLDLGCPQSEVHRYAQAVRRDLYDLSASTEPEQEALAQMRSLSWNAHPSDATGKGLPTQPEQGD